jgi:hypothetical protein
LWFIRIYKDSWMSQWPSTTIAGYYFVVCPPDRLLVYQLDRGVGLWL